MFDRTLQFGSVGLIGAALSVGPAIAADDVTTRPVTQSEPYLRAVEKPNRSIELQVATRHFEPREGRGPRVSLVGVAHIGDRGFYDTLQKRLDAFSLVLYESVKPPGTGGVAGDSDEERRAATEAGMTFIASVLERGHNATGNYPADLAAFRKEVEARADGRLEAFLEAALVDGWGRRLGYVRTDAGFLLTSLGAEGKEGGEGPASDLTMGPQDASAELVAEEQDNLQGALARALGLTFQLDEIDYDRDHFVCSDMAMDQLERAFEAEGIDFSGLGGSLAGSSLPGRIAVMILKLVQTLDIFFDGAIADMMKVVMIEMLADQDLIEMSMQQMGPGFERVLVGRRNELVISDLARILEEPDPDIESIAIFYGAAHMPDFAERLSALGYEPVGDEWLTAFGVNLRTSAISAAEVERLRRMIKFQMRLMNRR